MNPGITLPAKPVVPVHRTDGSGSTFGFTGYLAAQDPGWASGPGAGSLVEWPQVGQGVERTSGVLSKVEAVEGAIGHVDEGQAKRASLETVDLKNGAGQFVAPNAASMQAALTGADWSGADDYTKPLTASADAAAYPVTVAIYAMLRDEESSRTRQVLGFLTYIVDEYDGGATGLGLPAPARHGGRGRQGVLEDQLLLLQVTLGRARHGRSHRPTPNPRRLTRPNV